MFELSTAAFNWIIISLDLLKKISHWSEGWKDINYWWPKLKTDSRWLWWEDFATNYETILEVVSVNKTPCFA